MALNLYILFLIFYNGWTQTTLWKPVVWPDQDPERSFLKALTGQDGYVGAARACSQVTQVQAAHSRHPLPVTLGRTPNSLETQFPPLSNCA